MRSFDHLCIPITRRYKTKLHLRTVRRGGQKLKYNSLVSVWSHSSGRLQSLATFRQIITAAPAKTNAEANSIDYICERTRTATKTFQFHLPAAIKRKTKATEARNRAARRTGKPRRKSAMPPRSATKQFFFFFLLRTRRRLNKKYI